MPGDLPPAVSNTMGVGSVFAMGNFATVSVEMEISSYVQNLLSDYSDLPPVSPCATDPFWQTTENLLPDPRPSIHGTSSSEGTSAASGRRQASLVSLHTSSMSDKHTSELPVQERTAESVRSQLAEQSNSRAPPSYLDRLCL